MIIFDLTCDEDHTFEGWFQSQETFERQLDNGLISCPHCGSIDIRRVPSAVHVAKPAGLPAVADDAAAANPQAGIVETYRKLMSLIVSSSENVGKRFAEEARKIHYLEARRRSIHGEATAEEFESLQEEGIEILRLPVFKKEDLN